MSGFILAPEARLDLFEIWNYYAAEVGDAALADRMRDEIFDGIRAVARSSGVGHLRTDLAQEPLRFWRVRDYLIIYRNKEPPIEVARVLHGARDVSAILGSAPGILRRKAFLKLPLEERRRILESQADRLQKHYEEDEGWEATESDDLHENM